MELEDLVIIFSFGVGMVTGITIAQIVIMFF